MHYRAEQPYQHASYYTNILMAERAWTKLDLLNAADDLMPDSLQSFITSFFSQLRLEFLVHGNITKKVSPVQLFFSLRVLSLLNHVRPFILRRKCVL